MRSIRTLGFAMAIVAITTVASGHDLLLFRHCLRQSPETTDHGSVILRLYPYSAIRKPLSAEGEALASVLSGDEIVAIAVSHGLLINKAKDDFPSRTPLIISKRTPDTVIFVRESEVTVFPRVLLLLPQARLAEVRKDDIIASIFSTPATVDEDPEVSPGVSKVDRLRGLLETPRAPEGSKLKITVVTSPLFAQPRQDVEQNPGDNFAALMGEEGESMQIESDIAKTYGTQLSSRSPVMVVHRVMAGLTIRYVIPLRNSGMFSEKSEIIGRLAFAYTQNNSVTAKNRKKAWNDAFADKLGALEFADGDVVEYTFLERVSPFRQIALP
jgi:hypothetical protein